MLYKNDERVNVKEECPDEFKAIQGLPSIIRIISKSRKEMNPSGMPEPYPPSRWPFIATVEDEDGILNTWSYSKAAVKMVDGLPELSTKGIWVYDGRIIVEPKKDVELAYFLLYLSPICRSGLFELEDLTKEAKAKVEELSIEAELQFLLFGKNSPLNKSESKLRLLAGAWGVPNADSLDTNMVKIKLRDSVLLSEKNYKVTGRGIADFVNEANQDDPMNVFRSTVQFAIDNKVITFNEKEGGWFFIDSKTGEQTGYICPVLITQVSQKRDILISFLKYKPEAFETMKQAIQLFKNSESYRDLSWPELRKLAVEKGLTVQPSEKRADVERRLHELENTSL